MSDVASSAARMLSRDEDAFPWDDEQVDRLDAPGRLRVGEYWQGRANAELRVAAAFADLGAKLRATGTEPAVLELIDASIENERYHARLFERLASRYLGANIPAPEAGEVHLPGLPGVDEATRTALYAAGMCAINEGIATVWLKHCLDRSVTPLARAVNHVHLSDEIAHARVGWAHLASAWVTRPMREQIARRLETLIRVNVGQWLASCPLNGRSVPEHGLPEASEQREHVLGAVCNVVLPGFDHVGVDVSAADRWFRREFG
jgi:hypothetical protein